MNDLLLVIGNKNYSSWSLRPWIFMKQNNISFKEHWVALFTELTDTELAAYNSDFKVPVLRHGNVLVWDSLSILEYLSETFLHSGGWPQDSGARAMARSMSNEMHSSFPNIRNEFPMNCRKRFNTIHPSSNALLEIERVKYLWSQAKTLYGGEGEWLFGSYSIADAMFAPMVLRFHGYNIQLDTIGDAYINSVLDQPDIIDWINSGAKEVEIIEKDEIQQ